MHHGKNKRRTYTREEHALGTIDQTMLGSRVELMWALFNEVTTFTALIHIYQ
jgi:hypothetical protein